MRRDPQTSLPPDAKVWLEFIDGLALSAGDAVEQLSTARRLACPPQARGPVEHSLLDALARLRAARMGLELGDMSLDTVAETVLPVLEVCEEVSPAEKREVEIPVSWISGVQLPPVFAMAAAVPAPLTPEEIEAIGRLIALIRLMIEAGVIQGEAAAEVEALIAQLEELLASGSRSRAVLSKLRQLLATVANLLRRIASLGPKAGNLARRWLAALLRLIRALRPLLGRFLVFLGPIMLLLFAADVGWAAGTELAKIKVGDDETIGTWWGNRLWELLRGPCPELLEALNQAMRRWRELQRLGAPLQDQAEALARVIVLESEYARRCLAAGSPERDREERYIRLLQDEYRRLIERLHGGGSPPPTGTCHVKITLADVTYDGSDIGDGWAYTIVVQGQQTDIPEHELAPNQRETPNRVVYDADTGPCPGTVILTLTVEAREIDIFGNDVGMASRLLQIPCPGQMQERLRVRVREGDKVADLTFTFDIAAVCSPTAPPSP